MANSKRNFITKLKILFFSCCAVVLSSILVVNFILAKNKTRIIQTLNNRFFKPVGIDNIFYLPPNIIILRNFSISINSIEPDKKLFNIALLHTRFPLPDLFLKKTLQISSLSGLGLNVNPDKILPFITDNFSQILDFITNLPKQDFKLSLTGPEKKFNLELKNGGISATGALGKNIFSLKGLLSGDQIKIENFKLLNADLDCQFWGRLNSSLVEFKGFILIKNLNPAKKPNNPKLFILDIDSRIKLALPQVEIERLNFSVNNNPVKITAKMLLEPSFTCNLNLLSDFKTMDNQEPGRLKKVTLTASFASQEDKTIKLNGKLNIDFAEYKKEFLPLEKLNIDAKDLVLSFEEPAVLKISASTLNLFAKTTANLYDINLEDLNSKVYQLGSTFKPVKFACRFYGGRLQGRANIQMQEFMPQVTAEMRLKDVDANKLENVLIHFSKVHGKLSSQMFFVNYPELIFKGNLHIRNGYLNDFEFLKWLAKLFDLPSLKKVDFDTAGSDFIADKTGAEMYNMDLNSQNLKVRGNFKLKEADMVTSQISLSFGRKLLQQSAKFNALLKLLGTKQDLIQFNFALSGNFHNMNFQWLRSDFKDQLQKAIPDFAEKRLEKTLERIIESISEE